MAPKIDLVKVTQLVGRRQSLPTRGENRGGSQASAGVSTCAACEHLLCVSGDDACFMEIKCIQCLAWGWALT